LSRNSEKKIRKKKFGGKNPEKNLEKIRKKTGKKSGKDKIGKNSVERFNSLFNKETCTIKKRNHLI